MFEALVVAQETDAVEAALRELVEDRPLRERMGAAGKSHAAAASWDDNARTVLALYREALSR